MECSAGRIASRMRRAGSAMAWLVIGSLLGSACGVEPTRPARASTTPSLGHFAAAHPSGVFVTPRERSSAVDTVPADPRWSGRWEGSYFQVDGVSIRGLVTFTAEIEVRGDEVHGRTRERTTFGDTGMTQLEATLRGRVVDGLWIRFETQYDGSGGVDHVVSYEGTLDEPGQVTGWWKTEGAKGRFMMALERFTPARLAAVERPRRRATAPKP